MAGMWYGPPLEIDVLVGSAGGAMEYTARQAYIKHFSASGSFEEFVATQFSGFFKKARLSSAKLNRKQSLKQYLKES